MPGSLRPERPRARSAARRPPANGQSALPRFAPGPTTPVAGARRPRQPGHGYPGKARIRARRASVALVLVVVLAGAYCAVQLERAVPPVAVSKVLPAQLTASGVAPALPLPANGSTYVEVEGVGQLGAVRASEPLPLASVTKLMTALVVLKDHPLSPGQQGPTLTVSAAEAATYPAELAANDSLVKVAAGERLSELQALEALLVPSADNMADILAAWDAGSLAAFVDRMNGEAARLGLHETHYADASGLDGSSAGSAADMVRLAGDVMSQPVLRQIVAMAQVTLPLAGTVYNYDYDLGHGGIIGVKTGSTPQAGGNFVFAAHRAVGGRDYTVLGAVLGQGGSQPLQSALDAAKRLAAAAFSDLKEVTLLPAGTKVLALHAPWGPRAEVVTTQAVRVLGVPGEVAHTTVHNAPFAGRLRQVRAGERLATVQVSFPGGEVTVPATADRRVPPAPASYRLGRV